jgi:predicted HTH domain antitoxin
MGQLLQIELDDEVFLGMNQNPDELAGEMRLAAAVKWYELGKISQGRAAQLAGLSRAEFIDSLSRYGVSPFQETADDILKSLESNSLGESQ